MNTPAHAVFNLLVLGRRERAGLLAPLVAGALLPDLPMMLFYAYEKLVRGAPEAEIWSVSYYHPGWQAFFDLFNSIPLTAAGALAAAALGRRGTAALFASMLLHAATDLPLHHDDAHRHFFPFSDWRFASPVSYWDPEHFGLYVTLGEVAMVVLGSALLARRYRSVPARVLLAALVALYLIYFGYVVVVWL